jgi:hypothetical protein
LLLARHHRHTTVALKFKLTVLPHFFANAMMMIGVNIESRGTQWKKFSVDVAMEKKFR